jgi:hypothetical protein
MYTAPQMSKKQMAPSSFAILFCSPAKEGRKMKKYNKNPEAVPLLT